MTETSAAAPDEPRFGFAVWTFLIMLLGMVANAAFNHLTMGTEFSVRELLIPLCVSPLVFGFFATIIKTQLDCLSGTLIAFQNGFFWQQIFEGIASSGGGA